ncbi:2-oxoglutarate-dependent dioxygenase DAO-like [Dendrobium catenatum]|uniref:Gibberellin 2-beta-dioxygenase 8 n=1 Tax=Dendrobium catenatum TaxID=906689 RepID=A0A2I0X4H7_9ASPA|nr:2-oxoglutarate-dependent dioxygenase DAO-like [Dendrobium catenatum]PKU82815.1 Gibberellin 2-beta-dioxygenase 8 [Dendrobium catenatum]
MAMEEISVPVIDMAKFEVEKEKLRAAVVGLGCFRVINHGITETIIADMKVSARKILELPSEVKHRNTDVIPGSGYVYPNRLNPLFESLGIYDAKSTADIHAFCSCLGISSHDIEILSTYASALHGLIVDLATKIAESLGIVDCSFQEWSCHLRMNRYNFTKETIGHYGAHVHTDNSFINVILEDESNEGFEMMNSNGNFVAVNHVRETFLINVGDIGKVWSNGRLNNVKHSVVCKKPEPRFTIAFFILAPEDNKIEPQAELIDSENPRLYRSFDYREYKKIRTSTLSTAGEVLLHWAIDEA